MATADASRRTRRAVPLVVSERLSRCPTCRSTSVRVASTRERSDDCHVQWCRCKTCGESWLRVRD